MMEEEKEEDEKEKGRRQSKEEEATQFCRGSEELRCTLKEGKREVERVEGGGGDGGRGDGK